MKQGMLFEIFSRIEKAKKEQKEIKAMYNGALESSNSYQKALDEYNNAKINKKKIEAAIKDDFVRELDKLEILKNDIYNDNQLLADACLVRISKGDKIEINDKHDNHYEPVFSVRFKKI